jgi:DNA-binding NarL/FixJ family response regulator
VHARSASELGLTARQGQVLALLMKGRSNKHMSRELKLAERTVKAHMSAVMERAQGDEPHAGGHRGPTARTRR